MPDGVTACTVDVSGGSLAVLDTGPAAGGGATAVLVPGYTGSKEDFLALLCPLAADRRIVTYDQRGQHESIGPDDDAAYAVEALAGELLELLAALGDGPVHLLGHSFGGLVARAAALRRPQALRSLTLLDSGPAALDGRRADRIRELRPVLDECGLTAVWDRMAEQAVVDGAPPATPEVTDFLRRRFFASSAAGLRAMGDALLAEPDRVEALRATGLPILVACGAGDDAWPPAEQARMAERLGARRAVIADAVHSPNVENPEETVAVLAAYWRDVDGG